jgi:uncharacterized protein YjiS (DUF1127 family)
MAIAFVHRPARRALRTRDAGSLSHLFRGLVSAWRSYRAERELESMSYDMRKDIGFRSSDRNTR